LVPEVAPAPKPLDRSVEEGPAPVQTQQGLPPHPDAKPVKDAKSVPMPKPLD